MNIKRSSPDKSTELRRLAEEKLRKLAGRPEKLSPEDFSQIVHELHVHQIELEMQNEELRDAQEKIEISRSNYVDLYDFAPVGYFTFDSKGLILEVNLTAARLLGMERRALTKKPFSLFIHKDYQDLFFLHQKKVIKTNRKHSCEIMIKKKNKSQLFVHLESCAVKGSKINTFRSVMTDMTEHMKKDNALRKSESLFRRIFESNMIGIAFWKSSGNISNANNAFLEITGYSRKDLLNGTMDWKKMTPSEYRDQDRKKLEEVKKKGFCEIYEKEFIKKDGTRVPILIGGASLEGNKDIGVTYAINISKSKIAEKELENHRYYLEQLVNDRTAEIESQKLALEQKNIALREIIGQIEVEKSEIKEDVLNNVNELIIPIIKNLKTRDRADDKDINLLTQNLKKITSSFGSVLSSRSLKLTPREIEICNMIEKGFTSKEIAGNLHITDKSIEWHRKNIRKKLALSNKKINLTSYLRGLE